MDYIAAGILPSVHALFLLGVLLTAAGGVGRIVLGVPRLLTGLETGEKNLFSIGAGWILMTLGVLALGSLGLLTRVSAWGLVAVFAIVPILLRKPYFENWSFPSLRPVHFFAAALLFLSVGTALVPPTGNDALAYHLDHAKHFAMTGRIGYIPLSRESLWPYQTEMGFTLGLLLQGTALAQLLHWVFYPLTAAVIGMFGRRFYGETAGRYAAWTFLLCPVAFAQAGQAYVDLALGFYVLLAVYAFTLTDSVGEAKAAILSGILCAGALATKYLGLSAAIALVIVWLFFSKKKFKNVVLFSIASFAVAGVWYLRSWIHLGNPVYPFYPRIFGSGLDFGIAEGVGMGEGPLDFWRFGWNIVMHPAVFGGEMLGPLFLMFLPPLLFYVRDASRRSWAIATFAVIFIGILFKQSQQVRFYLAVVPVLSIGAGVAIDALTRRGPWLRRMTLGIFLAVATLHGSLYVYRARDVWPVVLGRVTPEAYLATHERSFRGYLYLKQNAKPGDRILNSAEIRHFYAENPGIVMNTVFFREELKKNGGTLDDYLKANHFDYIWIEEESDLRVRFEREGYETVYSYDFTEGPASWRYLILKSSSSPGR